MNIAIVGCGFVADYYAVTLAAYPRLTVRGVADRNPLRAKAFSTHHHLPMYVTLEDLLADETVEIVVNLTDPRSHFEVSKACLEAGKHVYSEKPLAMDIPDGSALVELARELGLSLSCAPCSLLGETAQTIWRALRRDEVGTVRLVYAEMDEGMVFRMPYRRWVSASGAAWPFRDEFEVGTVLEHAGYVVTWLPAFFGPATEVTGFAASLVPEKVPGENFLAPDFASACIRFTSGVVARVTCSLVASHDHSLRIFGDRGVLRTDDTWLYSSVVKVRRSVNVGPKAVQLPWRRRRLMGTKRRYRYRGVQQMDFARGVDDLAEAIDRGCSPRLSAEYSLHVTELVLALQRSLGQGGSYEMTTTCQTPEPMPWAR